MLKSENLTIRPFRSGDVQAYHFCEVVTEFLILSMLLFSPWAFGTTEPWSIWTMNICGYLLGVLWLEKLVIRSLTRYAPGRWESRPIGATALRRVPLTSALALCSCGIVGYCLIAALNARARYDPVSMCFTYYDYVSWLPASLDSASTWQAFWSYLALAISFWAMWDWLQGKESQDVRGDSVGLHPTFAEQPTLHLPLRLRRLIWVLAFSGALLGLEGIVQRQANCPKLLFLVKPEIHQEAQEQFASYAYRANAAQYFNLLWPVCLGFWWLDSQSSDGSRIRKYFLLMCVGIMAACPIISSGRGGAFIDFGLLLAATFLLMFFPNAVRNCAKGTKRFRGPLVLFFAGALALGFGLGWSKLRLRMNSVGIGFQEREQLYETARRISTDYPLFGTGPGTFGRVFQLYRASPGAYWPAQLHNDWLETRVTFGWFGSGLIGIALLLVVSRWFGSDGFNAHPHFVSLLWLSMVACLVQARWDFPLQVYSILFLFLCWCAVLFTSKRPAR